MRAALLLPLIAAAQLARAQQTEARFLTEFRRVGPDGAVIAADSAGAPREIISPAMVRNGYTSFHLVVKGQPRQSYALHLAANPDGVLRPSLARVHGDALEPVTGLMAAGTFNEKGVGVYWVDVWAPAATNARRVRLEAQLNVMKDWVITPLEVRVLAASVPVKAPAATLPVAGHSAAAPFALLRQYLCGTALPRGAPPATGGILARIRRNAAQDILIARKLEASQGRAAVEALLLKPLGATSSAQAWCAAPPRDDPDPESYLRVRDALWRADQ